MEIIPNIETITVTEIITRLLFILIISGVLGLEREEKPNPAGIRTHILIGIGACVITIISLILPELYPDNIIDSSKIIAAIVSGIGFLGAGAIIKIGTDTRGVTTAANIWATAALGVCVGAGMYLIAIFVVILILFNLIVIKKVKSTFTTSNRYSTLEISFLNNDSYLKGIYKKLLDLDIIIISRHISEDKKITKIKLIIKTKEDIDLFNIKENIKELGSFEKISLSETIDI